MEVGGAALWASRLEAEGYLALAPRRLPLVGTEACPAGEAGTGADLFFYSIPHALFLRHEDEKKKKFVWNQNNLVEIECAMLYIKMTPISRARGLDSIKTNLRIRSRTLSEAS